MSTLYEEKQALLELLAKARNERDAANYKMDRLYELILILTNDGYLESDYLVNEASKIIYGHDRARTDGATKCGKAGTVDATTSGRSGSAHLRTPTSDLPVTAGM